MTTNTLSSLLDTSKDKHTESAIPTISTSLLMTTNTLSSLLDTSEDEHIESAIPTISTSLLMTTNKNPQSILKLFYLSWGTFDYLLEVPPITCTTMVS